MTNKYKKMMTEKLTFLSKEELIWLLLQYRETELLISETLVEASKYHIEQEEALEQIREYLIENKASYFKWHHEPERIKNELAFYMGKISGKELRKRLGFKD